MQREAFTAVTGELHLVFGEIGKKSTHFAWMGDTCQRMHVSCKSDRLSVAGPAYGFVMSPLLLKMLRLPTSELLRRYLPWELYKWKETFHGPADAFLPFLESSDCPLLPASTFHSSYQSKQHETFLSLCPHAPTQPAQRSAQRQSSRPHQAYTAAQDGYLQLRSLEGYAHQLERHR